MVGRHYFVALLVIASSGVMLGARLDAQEEPPQQPEAKRSAPPEDSKKKKSMFKSRLQRAIDEGIDDGLADRIRAIKPFELTLRSDALAICDALSSLPIDSIDVDNYSSAAYALVELFDSLNDADVPAYEVISTRGLTLLTEIFDAKRSSVAKDVDSYLLTTILRILARYGTLEGTKKVIEAAESSFLPHSYAWSAIFAIYDEDHPHRERLYKALSRRIPSDNIAVALLETANQHAIEDDSITHPFDSPDGKRQLQAWLQDRNPEHFSYAHSAAVALAFISNPERDQLFGLALDHANPDVQLEGAWAAARLGRDAGVKVLARYCLDVNHAARAQMYLKELKREDAVPPEANDAAFIARAKFSEWLSHPNELGRAPDEVEVVDQRELRWPLEKEPKTFSVVRYVLKDRSGLGEDDIDCGLVGSMTWCFFMMEMNLRPPEDVYAIHAYWEMENEGLIRETEVVDEAKFGDWLNQWTGPTLDSPTLLKIAKMSRRLKIRSRQVALVSTSIAGEPGWVVLDGADSTWYPASEQPNPDSDYAILKIHVGRQLLGFSDTPDRMKFLHQAKLDVDKRKWINTFEGYMNEAKTANFDRQVELFDTLLDNHFKTYIDYQQSVSDAPRSTLVIDGYEKLLKIARDVPEDSRSKFIHSFSVIDNHLTDYVDALIETGRTEHVQSVLELVAPYLEHNRGYGMIGKAAYKAKLTQLAEQNFLKLREGMEGYYRSDTMSLLARIWFERGDKDQASELLIDCLTKVAAEFQESQYRRDRALFSEEFDHHRGTFLELFPNGLSTLVELGIDQLPGTSSSDTTIADPSTED